MSDLEVLEKSGLLDGYASLNPCSEPWILIDRAPGIGESGGFCPIEKGADPGVSNDAGRAQPCVGPVAGALLRECCVTDSRASRGRSC